MGELAMLDVTGDTKLIWNKSNQAEVDAAKELFKKLKKKNYIAYTVKDNGDTGEIIHSFNPNLERIIMMPPIIGG
jgi:hypothetical protein